MRSFYLVILLQWRKFKILLSSISLFLPTSKKISWFGVLPHIENIILRQVSLCKEFLIEIAPKYNKKNLSKKRVMIDFQLRLENANFFTPQQCVLCNLGVCFTIIPPVSFHPRCFCLLRSCFFLSPTC